MITVRELINELTKYDMNAEVRLSIDEIHQTEHGTVQGYVFDIDSIEYEYGASMIKFKDYRSGSDWIPCKERLPDKNGRYLITWHSPRGKDRICEKEFTNGSWNSSFNITAWMPFPEPYKGGDAE